MSTPVFSSPFVRSISVEIDGVVAHGTVTQMLPLAVNVALVAPYQGLSVAWNLAPQATPEKLERFLDEQLCWDMLRELYLAANLVETRLPTLKERFVALDSLRERAWKLAHNVDLARLKTLNGERAKSFASAMQLKQSRREEAGDAFRTLRQAHEDIERATVKVFADCLPELAETEFVRCVDGGRLTAFGNVLWERVVVG